jgi:hypothetical protein
MSAIEVMKQQLPCTCVSTAKLHSSTAARRNDDARLMHNTAVGMAYAVDWTPSLSYSTTVLISAEGKASKTASSSMRSSVYKANTTLLSPQQGSCTPSKLHTIRKSSHQIMGQQTSEQQHIGLIAPA